MLTNAQKQKKYKRKNKTVIKWQKGAIEVQSSPQLLPRKGEKGF